MVRQMKGLTMDRIEKVARAISSARRGYDERPPPMEGSLGVRPGAVGMSFSEPAWKEYVSEAKGIVAAFDVLKGEL